MDIAIHKAIAAVVPNCYGTVAPPEAVAPYAVWQRLGGEDTEYLDAEDAPQVSKVQIQVRIFSADVLEPKTLMKALTDAFRSDDALVIRPIGKWRDDYDHDMNLFVADQDYEAIGYDSLI